MSALSLTDAHAGTGNSAQCVAATTGNVGAAPKGSVFGGQQVRLVVPRTSSYMHSLCALSPFGPFQPLLTYSGHRSKHRHEQYAQAVRACMS